MEKKFLRYTIIGIIFFVGLSMGVSYQDTNRSKNLQDTLDSYETEITTPNNDFTPVNPSDNTDINDNSSPKIKHNLVTGLAKDGEYVIKKGLDLVLDKSDDVFRFIFGM
ncbi:hypothetical protein KHQ81_06710 [Mycoplasmatota bacterium]|nr:hypothetical protein KHQ81_06710 [Mycoplasmatota bacterium]